MDQGSIIAVANVAMRWGHRSMMENVVERMKAEGMPYQGFMESFDDIWGDVDTSAEAARDRVSAHYKAQEEVER